MIIIPEDATVSLLAKLHPFLQAHKPHITAVYQDLSHKNRLLERHYAHILGEWRHPALAEDDKAMDVIRHQHQTNRSWQHCYCLLSEKPDA